MATGRSRTGRLMKRDFSITRFLFDRVDPDSILVKHDGASYILQLWS